MRNDTQTPIDKLVAARTQLVLDEPFFGTTSTRLKFVEDGSIQTLCTDGKVIRYNPEFVAGRDLQTCKIDVCHETLHCTNGHIWRIGTRDPKRANVAGDYAVNFILKETFGKLPEGYLYDPQFDGMSFEEIYNALPDERNEDGDGAGAGPGASPGEFTNAPQGEESQLESNWKVATIQAANAAQAQGKLPGSLRGLIATLKETPIDWRAATLKFAQETCKDDYTWTQPNVRYVPSGLYLPSLKDVRIGAIVLAIDTSGSVASIIPTFGAHMQTILDTVRPKKLYVMYCDAGVQGEIDEYEPDDTIVLRKDGGGGTDFRPVFERVDELGIEPACLIYLTDLYGSFPDVPPSYPTLWASITAHKSAPFGETIYINGGEDNEDD